MMALSDETLREVREMAQADREWAAQADKRLEAARHVLWQIGDPRGYEPGSFTTKLLEAWTCADPGNAARLTLAFPILGTAVAISRGLGADELARWGGIQ